MKSFIGNQKLKLLMRITLVLIRRAEARSSRVRELIASEQHVLQIQTADGVGGHFVVADGRLSLRMGLHPKPDFTQIWCDGNTAVKAMTNADKTDLLRAFEDGKCEMRGRFIVALWFNEVMKLARPGRSNREEPRPAQSSLDSVRGANDII